MGAEERGDYAPRQQESYFCANGHETQPTFAADAQLPDSWDCPRCGLPASREEQNPPAPPRNARYKTHLAYVKERRSDDEAAEILQEALHTLRDRRKNGEIIF